MGQVLVDTLNREDINWSQTSIKSSPPSDVAVSLDQMKFGLSMYGIDLNDPAISYFDIKAHSVYFVNNGTIISTPIDLQPCRA